MTRVTLLQLPIPRHTFGLKTGNIPLGAACLKLAARDTPGTEVEVLAESIASYLGDAALLELLSRRRPDVVGFTVFSWNLERSLHLAARLKDAYGPRIDFGGPEITPDNAWVLAHSAVDHAVIGEGEQTFAELLCALRAVGVAAADGISLNQAVAAEVRPFRNVLDRLGVLHVGRPLRHRHRVRRPFEKSRMEIPELAAAAIRAQGEAEADVIFKKGEAEAKAMNVKAEAYQEFNQAAIVEQSGPYGNVTVPKPYQIGDLPPGRKRIENRGN